MTNGKNGVTSPLSWCNGVETMNPEYDVITSHMYCLDNYESISLSKNCVCIYCKQSFAKEAVIDWVETEKEKTAICPFCGIDAVIGDAPIFRSQIVSLSKPCISIGFNKKTLGVHNT